MPKENLQEGHKILSSSNNINTLPEEAIQHKFMSEIDKANVRIEPKTENIEMKESNEDHDLESVLDENSSISIQHVKAEVENMDPEYEKLEVIFLVLLMNRIRISMIILNASKFLSFIHF